MKSYNNFNAVSRRKVNTDFLINKKIKIKVGLRGASTGDFGDKAGRGGVDAADFAGSGALEMRHGHCKLRAPSTVGHGSGNDGGYACGVGTGTFHHNCGYLSPFLVGDAYDIKRNVDCMLQFALQLFREQFYSAAVDGAVVASEKCEPLWRQQARHVVGGDAVETVSGRVYD